jgi:hypothetical protein
MDDDNWEMVKSVFEAMNVELTAVMRRYTSQGSFALWDTSKPSVWLTAWVIRNLESVAFQVSANIEQVVLRPPNLPPGSQPGSSGTLSP